jgi:homoserine kinase
MVTSLSAESSATTTAEVGLVSQARSLAHRTAGPGAAPRTAPRTPPLPHLVPSGESPTLVRVRAPLSIANVGPGFDHFGLCLEGPADVLELRSARRASLEVYGDGTVPRDLKRNVATAAALELFRLSGVPFRAEARLFKGYRGASGIGSSGASAVAGALAAAALLGQDPEEPSTVDRVLRAALRGEREASGTEHWDNIAASLFGGFVLVEPGATPRIHRVSPPPDILLSVVLPELRVETRKAREALPDAVPRGDAVANVARASALVHGLLTGDLEQVGRNLDDRLAEPYRASLVPGLADARAEALRAGAWGVALSGSGPAVFAIGPPERAKNVGAALERGFALRGIRADAFTSRIGTGAELVGWS